MLCLVVRVYAHPVVGGERLTLMAMALWWLGELYRSLLKYEHRLLGLMSTYALADARALAVFLDEIFDSLPVVVLRTIRSNFNNVKMHTISE